jgi:glucose dehydrogenase
MLTSRRSGLESGRAVRRVPAVAMMLLVGALQIVRSQSGAGDWPMYNRDLAGTRYSPLTQINRSNVGKLARAWSFAIGRDQTAGTLSGGFEF